jgi:hypothetical protein
MSTDVLKFDQARRHLNCAKWYNQLHVKSVCSLEKIVKFSLGVRLSSVRLSSIQEMVLQPFYGKGQHPLLLAGSGGALEKI